jgi:hypothetical protein
MRYGTFQYGAGVLYGETAVEHQLWALLVDWNGDGQYDSFNEANRMTDLQVSRGRKNLLDSSGTGFEPVGIGRLTIELDNTDGRFDPFNERSPLYPYVRPGVRIAVLTRLPGGASHPVFAGRIEDIVPIAGAARRVRLIAVDGLTWLADQVVELHIQSGLSIDAAIAAVLAAAQWPWGTELEASTDTLAWFWAPAGKKVRQVLDELIGAHLGQFFAAADGAARFYSRAHALQAASVRIEQDDLAGDVVVRSPWEVIKNRITLNCHPRALENTAVVWQVSGIPEVAAGESFEVWGSFQTNGGEGIVGAITTPAATTDYTVNTAADGSGTDLTGSCSVSVLAYAGSVQVRLTNGSAQDGYITLLQVRGQALADNPVKIQQVDEDSQALYGPKSLTIDTPFLQDPNLAAAIAEALIDQLAAAQVYPTVTLTGRPEIQFALDLFDYVDLVIAPIGVAGVYRLAWVEHRWASESGQATVTQMGFEPVGDLLETVWTFPAQIGIDTIFSF